MKGVFEQTTTLQFMKVFFFRQDLIFRVAKVFFRGNLADHKFYLADFRKNR